MAMNGNQMGIEVADAIKAFFSGLSTDDINNLDPEEVWKVVCTKIVAHITANGVATGLDSNSDTHSLTIT